MIEPYFTGCVSEHGDMSKGRKGVYKESLLVFFDNEKENIRWYRPFSGYKNRRFADFLVYYW